MKERENLAAKVIDSFPVDKTDIEETASRKLRPLKGPEEIREGHRVAEDCEELAPSLGFKDAWAVAARFAARELPEIFHADDPAGAVELPIEDRNPLTQLVTGLPVKVFTASDSLRVARRSLRSTLPWQRGAASVTVL